MNERRKKTVAASAIHDHVHKVFPNDLNHNGTIFGGSVMSILDRLALVVAERHSEKICVTVSIDALHFLAPAIGGDILIFKASINRSWNSSMEIGIKVLMENSLAQTKKHLISAYFTFVALDSEGKTTQVPLVIAETSDEKRRYYEAEMRRLNRVAIAEERKRNRELMI